MPCASLKRREREIGIDYLDVWIAHDAAQPFCKGGIVCLPQQRAIGEKLEMRPLHPHLQRIHHIEAGMYRRIRHIGQDVCPLLVHILAELPVPICGNEQRIEIAFADPAEHQSVKPVLLARDLFDIGTDGAVTDITRWRVADIALGDVVAVILR